MNILFCIGRNYRDFSPLNHFAQRFAKEYFAEIHQILFCDSMQPQDNLDNILEFGIKQALNLIILTSNQNFKNLLEVINAMQIVESLVESFSNTNNVGLECQVQGKVCKIWLLDLQRIFTNKIRLQEIPISNNPHTKLQANGKFHKQLYLDHCNLCNKIFLYLLGLDTVSAQVLIGGIAKDFGVNLEVLNADSNLGILSATSKDSQALQEFANLVQVTFVDKIFASSNLAQSVIALLAKHQLKITTAESCTGGLIAYYLTKENGASAVFDGGIISYANVIKESWLEVKAEHLEGFGAVSEVVVRDMLEGALKLSRADFALATSGIAGPSGGSKAKPVGTVFIGVKNKKGEEIIECLHFNGDRNYIQEQATIYAYLLFLRIFLLSY